MQMFEKETGQGRTASELAQRIREWLAYKKMEKVHKRNLTKPGTVIRSQREFDLFYNMLPRERQDYEKQLAQMCAAAEGSTLEILGICQVCCQKVKFHLDFLYGDGVIPNYRERMTCPLCGLNNLQRYIVHAVLADYVPGRKIYMYEQITAVYQAVKQRVGTENIVGSEYVADNLVSGTVVRDILHENAECLSFDDDSFDIVVSCDVFEHVNDYKKCFLEASRILKKNGKLYLSVPFHTNRKENHRRAGIQESGLVYFDKPHYHGNPMSDEGSLVFWDYGWDMLDDLKRAGFHDVYMQPYYSIKNGNIGGIPYIFVAIK